MPHERIALLISLLAFTASTLPAQQQPTPVAPPASSQPVATLRVNSRLVVLDVIVHDGDGRYVKGLKASDFALTEDGEQQKIASLVEHNAVTDIVPPPPVPIAPLPSNTFTVQPPIPDEVTKTVIVVSFPGIPNINPGNADVAPGDPDISPAKMGLLNSDSIYTASDMLPASKNTAFALSQLKAYIQTLATGSHPIAIYRIDQSVTPRPDQKIANDPKMVYFDLHLVQALTTDPKVLLDAVESKRILSPVGYPTPHLHRTDRAFNLLAYEISEIPGHINLIWYSAQEDQPQSVNSSRLFSVPTSHVSRDILAMAQQLNSNTNNVLRLNRVSFYPINLNGPVAPHYNFTLFTLDPNTSGLNATSNADTVNSPLENNMLTCQSLMEEASRSGGRAYCNTNGFKEAIADAVETGSHYYTLSYVPTNSNWNGKYRKIKIDVPSVTTQSAGDKIFEWLLSTHNGEQRISYRDGYYAIDAPDLPKDALLPPAAKLRKVISASPKGDPGSQFFALKPLLAAAVAFSSPPPADLHFTVSVDPAAKIEQVVNGAFTPADNYLAAEWREKPFRNYQLHYTIDPQDLRFAYTNKSSNGVFQYRDNLQFVIVVYRDDDGVVNSLSTTTPFSLDEADYYKTMQAGLNFDQTIAVPIDGRYYLRVVVLESSSKHIGAIEIPPERISLPAAQTAQSAQPETAPN
jgi:VWFA-related protein